MGKFRSMVTCAAAFSAVLGFGFSTTTVPGVALLSGTLLVMGGNTNGQGKGTEYALSGCQLSDCTGWPGGYLSTEPGTKYAGYDFTIVPWSAVAPFAKANGLDYDGSQIEGLQRFEDALTKNYVPGTPIVGVGISGASNVMYKELRKLQAARDAGESAPSPDDLSFVLVGAGNRPGGIFSTFAGVTSNGVTFDGPAPSTDYDVLDVSYRWDPVSDFPTYPINLLALTNSLIGYLTLHSEYRPADPTDESTYVADVTVGNTRYLLLNPDHLPLLKPLELLGVSKDFLNDVLRPPLEFLIELGYNRNYGPDAIPTPTTTAITAPTTALAATTPDADAEADADLAVTSADAPQQRPSHAAADTSVPVKIEPSAAPVSSAVPAPPSDPPASGPVDLASNPLPPKVTGPVVRVPITAAGQGVVDGTEPPTSPTPSSGPRVPAVSNVDSTTAPKTPEAGANSPTVGSTPADVSSPGTTGSGSDPGTADSNTGNSAPTA